MSTSSPAAQPANAAPTPKVSFVRDRTTTEVLVDGKLFTAFNPGAAAKPYLHPVLAPNGKHITRAFPMASKPGEEQDHPHHTSLWFAHGDVNGADFWHNTKNARIVSVSEPVVDADAGTITSRFEWRTGEDKGVCTEDRVMRFAADGSSRTIDFDFTLTAPADSEVTFGDPKEGTFAMRLVKALCLKPRGEGSILSSTGHRDAECWGKRAAWMEYAGPIDGQDVGVAIFDHPLNHAHPTWWHARDYGLFAANPFGAHDFEGQPAGTGKLTVAAGKSARFRYRVVIHDGRWTKEQLDAAFVKYAGEKAPAQDGR